MQGFVRGLLAAGLALVISNLVHAADDPAQPGTRWSGVIKKVDPEGKGKKKRIELTSTEVTLTIKTRTGKDFTGEMRVGKDKDPRVTEITGKIDEKGIADFRTTERLKGAKADDVVDNRRYHGTFKDDFFKGNWIVPGNDPRGGEIELKLEKPKSKNP